MGAPKPVGLGDFWIAAGSTTELSRAVVLDRFGDEVASGSGVVVQVVDSQSAAAVTAAVARATRRRGPVTVEPIVWMLQGNRATQVPADEAARACEDLDLNRGSAAVVVLQG